MNIIDIIQRYGVEYLGRFYSTHRAVVMDNKDPDGVDKLFVNIPSILDSPTFWAYPKCISGGPKSGTKNLTPPIGSIVWVEFERGEPTKPVWTPYGWAIGQVPTELKGDKVCGIVTPSGNKVYLKEDEGILYVYLNEGTRYAVKDGTAISITREELVVNGGENGGLTNTPELKTQLDKLTNHLQNNSLFYVTVFCVKVILYSSAIL